MGDAQANEHQLWVNLSALGDGNIFAVLPQLMQKMLDEERNGDEEKEETFDLILPSDDAWQTKIYYKLVERQRIADALEQDEGMMDYLEEAGEIKLHDWNIQPKKKSGVKCEQAPKAAKNKPKLTGLTLITWTVSDIAKAGRLLSSPPISTDFEDEQEMRRVYTLIYDVFRYKNALTTALNDVAFFQTFPLLHKTAPHVWLLFYDLYHRGFKKRETRVIDSVTKLFPEANLTPVENSLWELRTKLAAAVARLRIQHNALSLSDLLPDHLKDEKVTAQTSNNPVTCWVNNKKIKNVEELKKQIESTFNLTMVKCVDNLRPNNYKWDKHCPQIICFHGFMRAQLARSDLVKKFKLVIQDKSFCWGPATFAKTVFELELTGSVIQTHVNSPRTTAYLATILSHNEKIKKLMAFSAGQRKNEYETYFNQLGMSNILIFSDRLIDVSPDAHYMEEVVAVFATPPNSYSAVSDPIDLVCSRGGDLSMLEVLTESEETKDGNVRVLNILDEQKRTLRFAMSRPQIQFVLYETHSELDAENGGMVQKTVKEVNKIAKLHHAALQGKLTVPTIQSDQDVDKEINNNENLTAAEVKTETETKLEIEESKQNSVVSAKIPRISLDSDTKFFENIKVPDADIFDVPDLPNLCPSDNGCIDFSKEGCYLALLQRKQVIRLDNKYMIQMAENRGLFGRTSTATAKSKTSRGSKKKEAKAPVAAQRTKRRIKDAEVARIAAPTHTFLRHTKVVDELSKCARCQSRLEEEKKEKPPMYQQWWSETTRHIVALRTSLIKHKVIPSRKQRESNAKAVVDSMVYDNVRIDEIVAKSRGFDNTQVPIFPKLKLSRENEKAEKVQKYLYFIFNENTINNTVCSPLVT